MPRPAAPEARAKPAAKAGLMRPEGRGRLSIQTAAHTHLECLPPAAVAQLLGSCNCLLLDGGSGQALTQMVQQAGGAQGRLSRNVGADILQGSALAQLHSPPQSSSGSPATTLHRCVSGAKPFRTTGG
eukprot:scaffold38099_cov16-Tisochrysis_lutea.AAC.1